ncbi:hypothetical protein GGF46_003044 [Coemansia sp. RSA 552]|nr:hypothetical protein GGF46_003044 [Coemansia sp. RSA 552]
MEPEGEIETEVPICRVCRGEATEEEELYYPCRCTGSIKYVHKECLGEWVLRSKKRECELCGYKYAFSRVYDPAMPERMPWRIIARAIVQNVFGIIVTATRAAVVTGMWLCVLPYAVYWLTRFYIWSGQSATLSTAEHATEAAAAAMLESSVDQQRFVGFESWQAWYMAAQANGTVGPALSYTGVLDGATNSMLLLYTAVRLALRAATAVLRVGAHVHISESQFNELAQTLAEFSAKCVEGSVVTVVSILLFMAMFMLRDWIIANAPVDEDMLVDEEEEEEYEDQVENEGEEGRGRMPAPLQIEGRPIEAENPQHRPVFEPRPDELAALNDLPPDERPVRPFRVDLRAREQGARAEGAEPGADNEGDPSDTEQNRLDQILRALPEEFRAPTAGGSRHSHTDSAARTGWAYADEAYDDDDDDQEEEEGDNGNDDEVQEEEEEGDNVVGEPSNEAGNQIEAGDNERVPSPVPSLSPAPLPVPSLSPEPSPSPSLSPSLSPAPSPSLSPVPSPVPSGGQAEVPATFTGEDSRAIYAHTHEQQGGGDDRDDNLYNSDSSADEEMPRVDPGLQIGPHPEAEAGPEPNGEAAEPDPELMPRLIQRGDNRPGEFDEDEGFLEAVGFRGPLVNAVQYFALMLMMVAMVLALMMWLPYICGRAFVALHPARLVAEVLPAAIDAAGEAALDALSVALRLLPVSLWQHVRALGVFSSESVNVDESWLAAAAQFGRGAIEAAAQRLERAAEGKTLDDRVAMVGVGHMVGVGLAWLTETYTPRALRRGSLYSGARMLLRMAKIAFFICVELVLFPVVCGYCLDASLMPLLASASLGARWAALGAHRWAALLVHWLLGMLFMVHFARFVLHCRQVMRPGLLWFIRDPNDPEFHPMREILEDRMLPQQYNIARSALMYCGVILSCVGLSAVVAVRAAPAVFPIRWAPAARVSDFPVTVLSMVFLLPLAITWGRPNEMLHFLFSRWWALAAHTTRLSEFILGERTIIDEGVWSVHGLPVPLPRLWMPTAAVQAAFDEFDAVDIARDPSNPAALPTDEYSSRLQAHIDAKLAASHPHVRFTLRIRNFQAPALDTIPVVPGRTMLVPLDNNGRPARRFDYEAADNADPLDPPDPDLPAPAPESSFRDRRFRPEHYGVIYIPPFLRLRVIAVLLMGWGAVAILSATTLVLSLLVGRQVFVRVSTAPMHDVFALSIGLLVLLVIAVMVFRACAYLAASAQDGWVSAVRGLVRHRGAQAGLALAKVAVTACVFLGAVPAAYGLIAEIYFVVLLRTLFELPSDVDQAFTRTLGQAVIHNWMFGVLHVWVALSILRFFPNLPWSRHFERVFTGPPHTWQVVQAIRIFAVPILGLSLAAGLAPFAMTFGVMWVSGRLSRQAALDVVMLRNVKILALCNGIIIAVAIAGVLVHQACLLYRRWSLFARDYEYLVGVKLHNINDPVETHDEPPPAMQVGGANVEAAE